MYNISIGCMMFTVKGSLIRLSNNNKYSDGDNNHRYIATGVFSYPDVILFATLIILYDCLLGKKNHRASQNNSEGYKRRDISCLISKAFKLIIQKYLF